MSYDTITAYCHQDRFVPDKSSGWKGTKDLISENERWYWNLDGLDFTWHSNSGILLAQVSLPKRLYGKNIIEVKDRGDIEESVKLVDEDIRQRLAGQVRDRLPSLWSWEAFRVDACKNYPLGSEAKVHEVLNLLGVRRLPQGRRPPYRGEELSVEWPGKSRRYKAYSKYLETHQDSDAEGILRAESSVQRGYYLRRILKLKKASLSDVLTVDAWPILMGPLPGVIESLLDTDYFINVSLLDLLQEHYPGSTVIRLVGFCQVYQSSGGEELLRRLYSRQGYHKFMKMLRDVGVDPATCKVNRVGQLRLIVENLGKLEWWNSSALLPVKTSENDGVDTSP